MSLCEWIRLEWALIHWELVDKALWLSIKSHIGPIAAVAPYNEDYVSSMNMCCCRI